MKVIKFPKKVSKYKAWLNLQNKTTVLNSALAASACGAALAVAVFIIIKLHDLG